MHLLSTLRAAVPDLIRDLSPRAEQRPRTPSGAA
jgi:hypothetical protein